MTPEILVGDSNHSDEREAPKLRLVSRNEDFAPKEGARPLARGAKAADVYTSIGESVARRRQERGLSQSEFAFNLGVKLSQLKRYEEGAEIFSPDLLLRAAQILDTQPSKFFVLLAEKRLADLSAEKFSIEPSLSVLEEGDKIRTALLETISKCDSIINILNIIDVTKNV